MALDSKDIDKIKEELMNSKRPLFFFHDDQDGLCSFLLLYRLIKEGKGIVVKSVPKLDEKFVMKVKEYDPDKIFILDIAMVEQDFVDKVNVPIIWIDHHEPQTINGVKIFNPRIKNKKDNTPVTYTCYQVAKNDLWIAAIGCIGDWFLPDFFDEFKEKYPDLVKNSIKNPGDILFTTEIGKLAKIFSFVLKGKTKEAEKCFKILTRIETPCEILKQETSKGRFIYKRFEKINFLYENLLEDALKKASKDKIIRFIYEESKTSFSGDLANELLYRFPDKFIIVGREKAGEIRMSLRYNKTLLFILKKALEGIEGYGGGHEYACGANVKKEDFDLFIKRIREEIK